jgi:hypothetical protein
MRNLTRLDLEANLPNPDDTYDTDLTVRQLIIRTFSVEYELPRLRSLRLKGLLLLHNNEALPPLPGLRNLEHLQLISCRDYVPFLRMLRSLSVELKSLSICEWTDEESGEFDDDANDFVRSMGSLQRLNLNLNPTLGNPYGTLFDWSTLYNHASGIRSLKVHCTYIRTVFPAEKDASYFCLFCIKATNLQQLSISGVDIQPRCTVFDRENGSPARLLVSLRYA